MTKFLSRGWTLYPPSGDPAVVEAVSGWSCGEVVIHDLFIFLGVLQQTMQRDTSKDYAGFLLVCVPSHGIVASFAGSMTETCIHM